MNDAELLQCWRSGDQAAGTLLVKRYYPTIRAYFINEAPHDYEDLMQETFMRLCKAKETFEGRASVRVFLLRIAHFTLADYLRRRYRKGQAIDRSHSSLADVTGRRFSSVLVSREHHSMLIHALRDLPLEDLDLIKLYYLHGFTAPELAEILGIEPPTVRGRARKAKQRLRAGVARLQRCGAPPVADKDIEMWLAQLRVALPTSAIDAHLDADVDVHPEASADSAPRQQAEIEFVDAAAARASVPRGVPSTVAHPHVS